MTPPERPGTDDTIVMRPIRDDLQLDEPPTPSVTRSPEFQVPKTTTTVSALTRWISHLAESHGEPLSIDISALLREVTISLASHEHFVAWCAPDAQEHPQIIDDLGTFVTATITDPDTRSWRVRLIWHNKR